MVIGITNLICAKMPCLFLKVTYYEKIVILGSTGSIGKSTLSVIQNNPSDYQIFALVGGKNVG